MRARLRAELQGSAAGVRKDKRRVTLARATPGTPRRGAIAALRAAGGARMALSPETDGSSTVRAAMETARASSGALPDEPLPSPQTVVYRRLAERIEGLPQPVQGARRAWQGCDGRCERTSERFDGTALARAMSSPPVTRRANAGHVRACSARRPRRWDCLFERLRLGLRKQVASSVTARRPHRSTPPLATRTTSPTAPPHAGRRLGRTENQAAH